MYVEERKELARLGVPDHVIDYVLAQRPSKASYNTILWGGLVLMIGGALGAMVLVGMLGHDTVDANALVRAQSESALFYQYNFGISLILALFAGILLFGALSMKFAALTPKIRASQFVYGLMKKHNQKYLPKPAKMASLASIQEPDLYMRRLIPNPIRTFAWIGAALAAVTAAAFERDIATYEVMTPAEYIATPWFPWESELRLNWSEAVGVELGCGRFGGGRTSVTYEIVYQVTFPSDRTVQLDDAKPLQGIWIDTITAIDGVLVASGATFQRWRGNPPLHPKCLDMIERQYRGDDLARIRDLLRLDTIR
ncbi:MAG: hypothetical protein RIC52_13455 [Amphiplicatus sp.]